MKKGAASAPVFCLHLCWADARRWFWSETRILLGLQTLLEHFELQCWRVEILRHWGSYSCLGTFDLGHVPFYFPTYKMVWTNLSHNFIILFSMSKTYSRVLLTLICFWLAYSSVKFTTLMELKDGGWAEAPPAGVGTHRAPQSCLPCGNQQQLDQNFYSTLGTGRHYGSVKYPFPPRVTGIQISDDIYQQY